MVAPRASTGTVVARVRTDAQTAVRIQDGLAESAAAEAAAVAIAEEPDGCWSVAVHFGAEPDQGAFRALIASLLGEALAVQLAFETLPPTDWVLKSLEGLQPVEAGRFVVHGRHHRDRIGKNRIAVQIEATLAFGTGHHASTRGCLLALDRIVKRYPRRVRERTAGRKLQGRKASVLDIGTGSGVLAIAAAKAVRAPVLASDIDPRAAAIAREHARVNGVAAKIDIVQAAGLGARHFRQHSPFSLILANILLDPLRQLATPIRALVTYGGIVVLSGLLNAQAGPAIASYTARGFLFVGRIRLGGWTTLILARPTRARRMP